MGRERAWNDETPDTRKKNKRHDRRKLCLRSFGSGPLMNIDFLIFVVTARRSLFAVDDDDDGKGRVSSGFYLWRVR